MLYGVWPEHSAVRDALFVRYIGKSLRELVVRRNAVLQRSDWPFKAQWWTGEFYRRLRTAAHSYDDTEREISQLLDTSWTMLPDRLFRHVHV